MLRSSLQTLRKKYGKAAVAELRKSVDYGVETSSSSAVASKLSMDSKGNSALTTKRAVDTLKNSMHITSAQAEDIISLVANNFVDAAECIGVPTLLTLEISFAAKYNSDGTFSNVTIEQRHGDYAVESESEIKPLSFEDLKKSAEEEIDVCLASDLSSLQAVVPLAAADNYNRVAARDYAWQHTAPVAMAIIRTILILAAIHLRQHAGIHSMTRMATKLMFMWTAVFGTPQIIRRVWRLAIAIMIALALCLNAW